MHIVGSKTIFLCGFANQTADTFVSFTWKSAYKAKSCVTILEHTCWPRNMLYLLSDVMNFDTFNLSEIKMVSAFNELLVSKLIKLKSPSIKIKIYLHQIISNKVFSFLYLTDYWYNWNSVHQEAWNLFSYLNQKFTYIL